MTGIGAKVAHVRAAIESGKTQGHGCHWPGCTRAVPPAAWGCAAHWRKLPQAIRQAIWSAYKPGQEKTKTPSLAYISAARSAQEWIAANHPPERLLL